MESDGNNYKPILYLHCCPAQQHPSVPATDFPVSAFHSLSKVSTDPPLRQLCGPSPVLYEAGLKTGAEHYQAACRKPVSNYSPQRPGHLEGCVLPSHRTKPQPEGLDWAWIESQEPKTLTDKMLGQSRREISNFASTFPPPFHSLAVSPGKGSSWMPGSPTSYTGGG